MLNELERLIEQIRERLDQGAYSNEAAVSHGVLSPILRALGWDVSDPEQVIPEYSSGRGRVDFALCGRPKRPTVFVEVKGVGRSLDGDKQLFEYAFHEGAPLCLLTDGREWSFYLPSGQGSYDDRRLYKLRLDDRTPSEGASVFNRYLDRERVKSGAAAADASHDHRDASAKREAAGSLPQAWDALLAEADDLLMELLADKAESQCGFRPDHTDVLKFLTSLRSAAVDAEPQLERRLTRTPLLVAATRPASQRQSAGEGPESSLPGRQLIFELFGKSVSAPSATEALLIVLRTLAKRDPSKLDELAVAVKGRSRNHIARSPKEIYPSRPDLARATEFYPGWLVGLNIANREKMSIIREACAVFDVEFDRDVKIAMPNSR